MFGSVKKTFYATSDAKDIEAREEAHAVIRALNLIEMNLDAAIAAETFFRFKKGLVP